MFRLEDHELLHGSLGAFELDPVAFESRASEFDRLMSQPDLWSDLLGALLAVGEYQRQRTNARPFLFGTDSKRHDNAWRELLTGATRDSLQSTRQVLGSIPRSHRWGTDRAERHPESDHERLPRPVRGGASLRLAVLHG